MKYRFTIAGATEVPIRHHLAAQGRPAGGDPYGLFHPLGLLQCSRRLTELGGNPHLQQYRRRRPYGGRAGRSHRGGGVRRAAELYNLDILEDNIQKYRYQPYRFLALPPNGDSGRRQPYQPDFFASSRHRFPVSGAGLFCCRRAQPDQEWRAGRLRRRWRSSWAAATAKFTYVFYLDFEGAYPLPAQWICCVLFSDELPLFSFLGNYHEQGPEE